MPRFQRLQRVAQWHSHRRKRETNQLVPPIQCRHSPTDTMGSLGSVAATKAALKRTCLQVPSSWSANDGPPLALPGARLRHAHSGGSANDDDSRKNTAGSLMHAWLRRQLTPPQFPRTHSGGLAYTTAAARSPMPLAPTTNMPIRARFQRPAGSVFPQEKHALAALLSLFFGLKVRLCRDKTHCIFA